MNLDPCPFCAKPTNEVFFTEDYFAYVLCRSCGASGPTVAVFEQSEGVSVRGLAVGLWNRAWRPAPSSDDKTPPSPDSDPNSGTPEPIDTERWNWTVVDGAWWVCRRDHEKYEACEYSPATPEEIASAGKGEPPLMP